MVRSRIAVNPRRRPLPSWFLSGKHQPLDSHHHLVFWVQCFACGSISPMGKTAEGRAEIPKNWAAIRPMCDGLAITEVYASAACVQRAGQLAGMLYWTSDVQVQVNVFRPLDFVALKLEV